MPEQTMAETPVEAGSRYGDLVWLAYFALPGKGKRAYRLAVARRIVDGAARWGGDPERRRLRVLRRAMRPSRRMYRGLGPWLRALPVRLPDPAVTAALSRLDAGVRVACVLLRVAGMPRYRVRDDLVRLGVRDPWAVIEAAEVALLPPVERPDPVPDALARSARRPVLPIAVGGVLTAALVGVLVATEGGTLPGGGDPAAAGPPRLVTAPPDAWRHATRDLDGWPARGDLGGDRAFTGPAGAARAARGTTTLIAQLLYAGRVGGEPVAVLRGGDRIARYSGTSGALDVVTGRADPAAPVALGGGRYLLAPWDTGATTPEGREVAVRDGVTDPVTAGTRCGRGPLLDLEGADGRRTVGDLGGARPVVLAHRPPTHRAGAPEPRPARLKPAGRRLWERLGCLLPRPARPVTEAAAWEFWTGRLPKGGPKAGWVCTRMTFANGGTTAQATLLAGREHLDTGWCDDRRPVSGSWWRDPADRPRYLAAAARGLEPRAEGPLRGPRVKRRLLDAAPSGSGGTDAPVTLTARED
ncbi:hypothetical protein GCM10009678_46200 [Actinomadura kijaniata]|uniref:hypothetical protein n=1 Tax=Actinomadura kijaniata TaxID=46161 RepID=UPI002FE9921D